MAFRQDPTPRRCGCWSIGDSLRKRNRVFRWLRLRSEPVPRRLILFTSVATWCPNCRKQIPQLHLLRKEFTGDQLGLFGAAVDEGDSKDKLRQYVLNNKPPYTLATPWRATERKNFNQLVKRELRSDVLPATVVFDRRGKMISVFPGVPTISDIRRMLAR